MKLLQTARLATPRLLLAGALYAVLVAASCAYISIFNWWGVEVGYRRGLGPLLAAIGFGVIFWAIVGGFVFYVRRLDRFGRPLFYVLLLVLAVVLTLIWPGLFDTDSFAGIENSKSIPFNDWLGSAPIIQRAILQHIPFLGALTAVQVAFFALATAYACQTLKRLTQSNIGPIAVLLLTFGSAPLIYELMLVSRETWLAIASLFIAVECVIFFSEASWRDGRTIGRLLALGGVSYFVRSEAALYLVVIGLVAAGRWLLAGRREPGAEAVAPGPFAWRALMPLAAILAVTNLVLPVALPSWHDEGAYDISLWIEPIGDILNADERGLDPGDLQAIYAVTPRDVIHDDWANKDIVQKMWRPLEAGRIRPPKTEAERAAVRRAVVDIVRARPKAYVDSRIEEFRIVDAPARVDDEIAVQPAQAFIDSPRPAAWTAKFPGHPHYGGPFPDVRRKVEAFFLANLHSPLGAFQWAITPDLLMLAFTVAVFPVSRGFAFAALVLVSRAPALFLLMPAAQSKYFAPLEFGLPFILAGLLALAIQKALRSRAWSPGEAPSRSA